MALFKLAYADDWLTHNFTNTGILKWLLLLIIETVILLINIRGASGGKGFCV
jgi:hypothetical protein